MVNGKWRPPTHQRYIEHCPRMVKEGERQSPERSRNSFLYESLDDYYVALVTLRLKTRL